MIIAFFKGTEPGLQACAYYYKIMKKIILFIITAVFISTALYADTVILKNRTKVKGLVVDEYVDRIALSTVEGELYSSLLSLSLSNKSNSLFYSKCTLLETILFDSPTSKFYFSPYSLLVAFLRLYTCYS